MTTLITIPSVTAYHLPTPTSPILLSTGLLTLTHTPASPPTQPTPLITLSIGTISFPLTPLTPLTTSSTLGQYPTYVFTPAPTAAPDNTELGGAGMGTVELRIKDSTSPEALEETTALVHQFEDLLKTHNLWHVKSYYENAELGIAGGISSDLVTSTLSSWGSLIASKIGLSKPTPSTPSSSNTTTTTTSNSAAGAAATISSYTQAATTKLSAAVQGGAKYVEERAREFQAGKEEGKAVEEGRKGSVAGAGQGGQQGWEEVEIGGAGARK